MKIGLIGYGYWGAGYVARNIARVADLAVIIDPDPEKLVQAAMDWQVWGTRVSSEPEFAFKTCDAVWIATPAATHAGLVMDALANGCHVMCEKPFVMRFDEAEELAGEAETSNLALMVGHLSLYTRHHDVARANVDNAINERGRSTPMPAIMITSVRNTMRASISDHSVLWGLGPHDVASAIALMGTPEEVICVGNQHRAHITMIKGDNLAMIQLDWLSQERHRQFDVMIDHQSNRKWALRGDILPEKQEPLLTEAQAFVHLCEETSNLREYHRHMAKSVTSVLAAAEISMKAGMPV